MRIEYLSSGLLAIKAVVTDFDQYARPKLGNSLPCAVVLALQGVVNRKLQLIGGRNSKNGSGMEPIILDSSVQSLCTPSRLSWRQSSGSLKEMRNWRNLRAWMDSIIRYQIKRENLLEELNFLKLSARLRKTFISNVKNSTLVFIGYPILSLYSSLILFHFNGNDFSRMGKYLDLKKKKNGRQISIDSNKNTYFGNTIFNRVDFPVNFDLNLTEEERRRYNDKRYQDNF